MTKKTAGNGIVEHRRQEVQQAVKNACDQLNSDGVAPRDYVEQLSSVDTEGIPPTAHAIPLPTPLREDRAAAPLDPEQALANAPAREGSAFVVPKVLEGEEEA